MYIHVYLVSGDSCTLDLPIEKPQEFLNKIRPTEVFQRPLHQFLGRFRTVSINPDYIEYIDLETNDFPSTAPFAKATTIRQLSPVEFKSRVTQNQVALKSVMEDEIQRNVLLAYGMATFKSGRALCFEIQSKMARVEDRVRASQKVFNMPALFIYGENAGIYLVNTRNIAVWQVVPGIKKSAFFAVPGELVDMQKAKWD